MDYKPEEIKEAIYFMQKWIDNDLKELNGNTESNFTKWCFNNHKHINTAIRVMKEYLDIYSYQE